MATRNRYAEIMAQYAQTQPFSFTGIPSSYYGGQSGYSGGYSGGFDETPYTPYVAPVNRYVELMAQPVVPIGGGGGGFGASAEGQAAREAPMSDKDIARQLSTNESIGKFIDFSGNVLAPGTLARAFLGGGRDGGGDVGSVGNASTMSPGGGYFSKGGYVSMQHLGGPDPEGPDDGYAALKDGEFVINDKAVKKYGIELMNAINSGKISKGKLLGLLEM
jgi:hypothetical protein